jgi:hypothetical protein
VIIVKFKLELNRNESFGSDSNVQDVQNTRFGIILHMQNSVGARATEVKAFKLNSLEPYTVCVQHSSCQIKNFYMIF